MNMFLCVVVVLSIATPALAQQPGAAPRDSVVVVGGEGVIRAAPDRAWITVGAESRALNPKDAQRRNTEMMTPVLAEIRAAGVAEDAIRTIAFDLQSEWDYVDNRRVSRGYVARNTVEVRVDDISRVGELLEIAVGSGATTVSGVRFDLKDQSQLERDALSRAVSDARAKAEAIAAATGRAIDQIVRIEEQGVSSIEPPRPMFREAQLASADAPPIAAGQMEIRARVTVTASVR
jgi:hypothetical protein